MNKKLSNLKTFAKAKEKYLDFYQRTLPETRSVDNILEIGFDLDSLNGLLQVYPEALIHTLDFFKEKSPIQPAEIEEKGFFVYNMMGSDGNAKTLAAISSQFDIIIDHTGLGMTKVPIFLHLFQENLKPHGMYYIEDIPKENTLDILKAICDCNRNFATKMISSENLNKIIDTAEYSDMDVNQTIACFKKVKPAVNDRPNKGKSATKPGKTETAKPVTKSITGIKCKLSIIGDEIETVMPERYGPVHKDILISYLSNPGEASNVFSVYGSSPDFFFGNFDIHSERYRLEMARSFFSVCTNDDEILNALVNETVPVVLTPVKTLPTEEIMVKCDISQLQAIIGHLYVNRKMLNDLVGNGQRFLNKLSK